MSTTPAALDPDGHLGRVLRAHSPVVDPWLRRAAATGAEGGAVRAALAEVAPVASALAAGGDGDEAVLATVRAVLDLVGRGRWHPGRAQRAAVLEVLPMVASWVRSAPTTSVPALVAAADVVGRAGRLDAWAARLTGPPPPAERVRGALLVAAWRAGLARYRDAALREAVDLDETVLAPLLGVESATDVLERHRGDRWWWPEVPQRAGVVRRVGGFGPWGGTWARLPIAVPGGPTGWVAVAGPEAWAVVADVHGSSLVPLPGAVPPPARPVAPPDLPVPWDDEVTGAVPEPGGRALLVSRAHSYRLEVVLPHGSAAGRAA